MTCAKLTHLVVGIAFLLNSVGCASSSIAFREHPEFTHANVGQIRVGMSEPEVVALFGPPDERAVSTFGAAVGEPWQGLRYSYKFRDRSYSSITVHTYNDFIFSIDHQPPLLNSFTIKVVY